MPYHIGITLSDHAYTPEAFAYEKYLSEAGWNVTLAKEEDIPLSVDIAILFMGIKPIWKKKKFKKEVHEFHSLSVPPLARVKDFLKSYASYVPDGRIFLNEAVRQRLTFGDKQPYLLRDMGVDDNLFTCTKAAPQYNIIYCGSIENRPGLLEHLFDLANMGLRLMVVGGCSSDTQRRLAKFSNIKYVGRVSRELLPDLYTDAHYGLNYTPDIYPFNIQTSTKTLEYLAAGLGVISNRYEWIEKFAEQHKFTPLWLDNINQFTRHSLQSVSLQRNVMKNYSWNSILKRANFENWLSELIIHS